MNWLRRKWCRPAHSGDPAMITGSPEYECGTCRLRWPNPASYGPAPKRVLLTEAGSARALRILVEGKP